MNSGDIVTRLLDIELGLPLSFNPFPASHDFGCLLLSFAYVLMVTYIANNMDPNQVKEWPYPRIYMFYSKRKVWVLHSVHLIFLSTKLMKTFPCKVLY